MLTPVRGFGVSTTILAPNVKPQGASIAAERDQAVLWNLDPNSTYGE